MEVTRTYLQLTDPAQFKAALGDFPDVTLAHVPIPPPKLYRHCYRTVGEAFHWFDRWDWTDDEITAHLVDPNIRLYVALRDGSSPARCATPGRSVRSACGCIRARWITPMRCRTTSSGGSRLIARKCTR